MKVKLREIFKIYFITGIQLLGGGYIILPLLKKYLTEERNWMKKEELIDYLALSQCLPGIIAINISIFSGYHLRKIKGALAAITGLILPSFITILIIYHFVENIQNNKIIQDMFFGIRLSVIVLIFFMVYDIFKTSIKTPYSFFLFFLILFLILYTPLSPSILIVISILITLIFKGKCNV